MNIEDIKWEKRSKDSAVGLYGNSGGKIRIESEYDRGGMIFKVSMYIYTLTTGSITFEVCFRDEFEINKALRNPKHKLNEFIVMAMNVH
ncbi:immunoglobulin domain-containing family protein [Acinetobacter baumannii]|uniref:hypothetical protein n=1 Tax=Acinetobacter baumannii TaxID=470 RepID=UPI00190085C7|nr:hypothetical protein [Acinetobacter baumannii]MBJ9481154.1 hypothetical protein [Acinetobacter baumannii]MBJ9910030.1 hypothetical protein [Acinetobacter baumannii]MBJ9944517.1 hypothetical protein [Acinetobacter baumannii]